MIYINIDNEKGSAEIEGNGTTDILLGELAYATVEILKRMRIGTKDDKGLSNAKKVMYYAEQLSIFARDMKEKERESMERTEEREFGEHLNIK